MEQAKVELPMNRLIYVGFAILDLLKTLMYDFHYNYIKQNYSDSKLLFADTDSFTYQIQTDNAYEDFYTNMQMFEVSGFRKESPFYNDENKRIIGKIKHKWNGEIIEEFVGLRTKMYSLKTKKEEMNETKRLRKNVVKKDINHQDYAACLFEERKFMHTMQTIR